MSQRARTVITLGGAALLLSAVAAPVAHAETGKITLTSGTGEAALYPYAYPRGPMNPYGTTQKVYATSTTGQPVSFAVTGGCTVKTESQPTGANNPSIASITGTSALDNCLLTLASDVGYGLDSVKVTYTLVSTVAGQQVKYGKAMDQTKFKKNKQYVLGAKNLKTNVGKTVTFKLHSGNKGICTVVKNSSSGWLVKVGSKKGTCSVDATAPALAPNYAPLSANWNWKVS